MIHPQAWLFLTALPDFSRAHGVVSELESLSAAGDRYLAGTKRLLGAALIASVAAVVSVMTEHVVLAQVTIAFGVGGFVFNSWQRDKFNADWRRSQYLHGYVCGQNGDPPSAR